MYILLMEKKMSDKTKKEKEMERLEEIEDIIILQKEEDEKNMFLIVAPADTTKILDTAIVSRSVYEKVLRGNDEGFWLHYEELLRQCMLEKQTGLSYDELLKCRALAINNMIEGIEMAQEKRKGLLEMYVQHIKNMNYNNEADFKKKASILGVIRATMEEIKKISKSDIFKKEDSDTLDEHIKRLESVLRTMLDNAL